MAAGMGADGNKPDLDALYPFLADRKTDPENMNRALLDSVRRKAADHRSVLDRFIATNTQAIVDCAKAVANIYRNKGRLFTLGNGGSSCDASHIAVEFLHPVTAGRPALPAFDLSIDKTLMSAVANDVGFDQVYARQIENLVAAGDGVIAVSTSGNSGNLVNAMTQSRKQGCVTIALVGSDGGRLRNLGLDHCIVVDSDSIHRIQECHVMIYHILWDLVHTLLADERGDLNSPSKA